MNAGLLDFFILEASECIERLDGVVSRASATGPDLDAFARDTRALRGSATMAKVQGIADVAVGLERIGKALRDGSLHWSELLRGAVIAAIDDLKILIRGARTWGPSEDRLAAKRSDELQALAPAFRRRSTVAPTAGASAGFLAAETADVAAGLERLADAPGQIAAFDETLRRLRALRGVAALNDLPPLAEVVAAVDEAAKSLELASAAPTNTQRALFRTAAAVLREGSDAVHDGTRPDPESPAVQAFTAAAATFVESTGDTDHIVPISSLFPDGGGVHVLHEAPHPPTTPAQRFKLEAVSQAEHLRRLVSDARAAADSATRQRLAHELRGAVRSLGRAAESFGEHVVARILHGFADAAAALETSALAALEQATAILTARDDTPVSDRFTAMVTPALAPPVASTDSSVLRPTTNTPVVPRPAIPSIATPPAAAPQVVTPQVATPQIATPPVETPPVAPPAAVSGAALHDMLGAGIAGLSRLGDEPLSEPVPVEDDGVVPIQDLLYRGPAALRRAIELSGTLKASAVAADAEALSELYDLLELAAAE